MTAGDDGAPDLDPETFVRLGTIEVLNRRNVEELGRFYAEDLTYYDTDGEEGSLADLQADTERFHEAFPDIEADVTEVVVDDESDAVSFEYTIRGTQQKAFRGYEPSGTRMEARGIGYARLEGGVVTEYHLTFDRREMLSKLGHVVL